MVTRKAPVGTVAEASPFEDSIVVAIRSGKKVAWKHQSKGVSMKKKRAKGKIKIGGANTTPNTVNAS